MNPTTDHTERTEAVAERYSAPCHTTKDKQTTRTTKVSNRIKSILVFGTFCVAGYPAVRGFAKWIFYGTPLIELFHRAELTIGRFLLFAAFIAIIWSMAYSFSAAKGCRWFVWLVLGCGLVLFVLQDFSPTGDEAGMRGILDRLPPGSTWQEARKAVPRRFRAEGNRRIAVDSFVEFCYLKSSAKKYYLAQDAGETLSYYPLSYKGRGVPMTTTNELPYLGYAELLFDEHDRVCGVALHSEYFEPTWGGTLAENWEPGWPFKKITERPKRQRASAPAPPSPAKEKHAESAETAEPRGRIPRGVRGGRGELI